MDKAIYLQKQVRDNSEDLQKELRDMQAWEEQMKKKDFEIRNAKDDYVLPPVRSKVKKKPEPDTDLLAKDQPSKLKRIAASDYASWEKFDVDKACKEVVDENNTSEKKEKIFEIPSKEELEKEHAEATKYKEEGNVLVQKKEYAKAVGKYSQAIKTFPHDAVFYANRALCHLKLDNLHSADSDCTHAIKLDDNYVKAYHRRAMVRIELKRYDDAKNDLEKILLLEPSNKEAASKLKQVQEKLKKSKKPLIIAEKDTSKSSTIEKAIAEKLFSKKYNENKNEKNKIGKEDSNQSVLIEPVQSSTLKKGNRLIEEIGENDVLTEKKKKSGKNVITENSNVEKQKTQFNKSTVTKKLNDTDKSKEMYTQNDDLPPWLPKLKDGLSIIQPLKESPQQSKTTLKRIPVKEIPENQSIFSNITDDISEKYIEKEKIYNTNKTEEEHSNNECKNKSDNQETENLPPPPKSSVAFLTNWQRNTSIEFRYKYLKLIEPKNIPNIFKASMESNVFSDILFILNKKFVPNGIKVYDWLYYLSKLERFKALILFMSQTDKDALKNLIDSCKLKESRTDEEINNLYFVYEI